MASLRRHKMSRRKRQQMTLAEWETEMASGGNNGMNGVVWECTRRECRRYHVPVIPADRDDNRYHCTSCGGWMKIQPHRVGDFEQSPLIETGEGGWPQAGEHELQMLGGM